jgi:GT2 family glycosyltransferase/radical SAM superfamily enzyme YgiQ (UPF0313 family)/Flp pilus assembly protein TadD
MPIALINSPSLARRPVSRSMAGGLGFDGGDHLLLPPLDLATMASSLRQAGESVELIDADPLRLDEAGVCRRLEGRTWDVLLATVALPTLDADAAFLAELRRRHPDAKVFAKTLIRDHRALEALLRRSGADLLIHGEADLSIVDLVAARTRKGCAWLEQGDGPDVVSLRFEEGEPVPDLNRLPFPARDLLPNPQYVYPLLGSPVATLQTSRGCPYPCGYYCPYPLVEGVKWRSQSPERIAAEIKDIVERQGITKLYFRDATFTLNQERIERLCDLIVEAEWKLEWMCETRVDCLSDRLMEKMRAAGCAGILIGVETGDEAVMHHRQGKKGLTLPRLALVRDTTRRLGIRLHFLLIVGLPKETRESIVATYDLIQRYRPDTIGVTIITPYPGTPLYEEAVQKGWIDSVHWGDYGGHQVPMHTPQLSREDLITGKQFLEEGFAILQRRVQEGPSALVEAVSAQHYEQVLRWAYRLEPIARTICEAAPARSAVPAPSPPEELHRQAAADPTPDPSRSAPGLSVVIPTYNRQTIVRRTLLAFASQTFPPDQFEVLLVDDGSTDDTVAMVRRMKLPFPLRVLARPHGGANVARNEGIRAARGHIVVITGDDMIPEPSFLEAHATFHRKYPAETEAMLGFIDWSPEITITPFMKFIVSPEGGQQFSYHLVKNGKVDFRLFYTSNISLKRSFLQRQATLFDPDFVYPAFDDVELGYRLANQGMQIHFNPLAVAKHHHEITLESFVERQRKAGQMAVLLASKHPVLNELMLKLHEVPSDPGSSARDQMALLTSVLKEVEKPAIERLASLRVQNMGFDQYYARAVLCPLYQILLTLAFQEGVRLGLQQRQPAQQARQTRPATNHDPAKRYDVSIVVPVFNKVELTRQCLTALAAVTHGVEYEVIVVDDGSTDGTPEFLASLGGDAQIVRNVENSGFAKSCNRGAAAARGRYLVFLNNDTIPLEGWLQALVDEVEAHSDVAVVGSKLLYEDGTIQHAGVVFSKIVFTPYHIYRQLPGDHPVVNRRREFQCVTAACTLIRREAFETAGGFDEGYRNSFEDVDLCLKIREQGWRIVYQPKSVLYHLESQSPGRKAHDDENAKRLLERWGQHWWIPDEDIAYIEDGLSFRQTADGEILRTRLEPLTDSNERRRWDLVAEAQRLAQRQEREGLRALLSRTLDWPEDEWVLRWAAMVCRIIGARDLSGLFWERVLKIVDDPEARCSLAKAALEDGAVGMAEEHVVALLRLKPDHGEGWLMQAVLSMQRQEFEEAEKQFERAFRLGADAKRSQLGMGMTVVGQNQPEKAWHIYRHLSAEYPDDQEVLHWLLRVGTQLERWEPLSDDLERYIVRNPGDLSARFAYAGTLLRLGRAEAARKEYDTICVLNPGFEGLEDLAKSLSAAGSLPLVA